MRDYNGFTGEERAASGKLTKKAIADGIIPPPAALGCRRCRQKQGIIHYHNEDYSDPINNLEPLCWRCHMLHHSRHRNAAAVEAYFAEVAAGKQWPPVFSHSFGILRRDHGV